jgi:hypothetical protein
VSSICLLTLRSSSDSSSDSTRADSQRGSTQHVELIASYKDQELIGHATLAREAFELRSQIDGGQATEGAVRAMAKVLGEVLFTGEIGGLLRAVRDEGLARLKEHEEASNTANSERPFGPQYTLALDVSEDLSELPWELVADPDEGGYLLKEGAELIRITGAPEPSQRGIALTGYVVTTQNESFKFNAMKAATANLTRRQNIDVKPIQNIDDLKDLMNQPRALFCHLFSVDRRGMLTLGGVPTLLQTSSYPQHAYLMNVTPALSAREHTLIRQAGAGLVFGRQFSLSVKSSAESDRAFYHALGSGNTPMGAIHWARKALMRSDINGYQWASLTLTTAPRTSASPSTPAGSSPFDPVTCPAINAFPPTSIQPSSARRVHSTGDATQSGVGGAHQRELQQGPLAAPETSLSHPWRVSTFVYDTIRLIQQSQKMGKNQDQIALALRTGAMKQLSSLAQGNAQNLQGLTRSEQLTQQLITAGTFEDAPMTPASFWYGRSERLANTLGLSVEAAAQAAQSLVLSQAIWLHGGDALTRLKLARGLCVDVFQSYPFESPIGHPLISPEINEDARELGGANGTLWLVSQLSWAPEASTPFQGNAFRPTDRTQITAYHPSRESWQLFKRPWLIVDRADQLSELERYRVMKALREGSICGYSASGRFAQLYLPQDLKVIFLSDSLPSAPLGEVVIELRSSRLDLSVQWLNDVRVKLAKCGLDQSEIENRINKVHTLSFALTMGVIHRLEMTPAHILTEAIAYGIFSGAESANFTEASELYLQPYLRAPAENKSACLTAYLRQDHQEFSRLWRIILGDQVDPPRLTQVPIHL